MMWKQFFLSDRENNFHNGNQNSIYNKIKPSATIRRRKYLKKTTSISIFLGYLCVKMSSNFIIIFSGLAWLEDNLLDWMGNRNYTAEVI